MAAEMTKRERVMAALRGAAVDRMPFSFWRHFYDRETTAAGLAEAMLDWATQYQFDFLKVNPRAQYHVEGWGCRYQYSGQPHDTPHTLELAVKTTADWAKIEPLPLHKGALGEHLEALRLIGRGLKGEVPFIQTIFSPLAVLGRLAEEEQLRRDLTENPQAVRAALAAVTETFAAFARACLEAGADGIFFATTSWASRDMLTEAEYAQFGRPYDLKVLAAVQGATFNILHVCRENSMLYALSDYPVHALNWMATSPTNPSLGETKGSIGDKALIGGVSNEALTAETPPRAVAETRRAFEQTGGRRWLLAGDCSIPTQSRPENIYAVKNTLAALGQTR